MRARGQPARREHGREGGQVLFRCDGVEKRRDALTSHRVQRRARGSDVVGGGGLRQQRVEDDERGVFEQSRRVAGRVAPDLAADRIRRGRVDAGECERARVRQHRMPERRTNDDRPLRIECVERRATRRDAGRTHALLEPIDDLEPSVGLLRGGFREALADALLEFVDCQRRVAETAFQQLRAGL